VSAARGGEPDRYLAALLAPPPVRPGLLALAAFASELARVPTATIREPAMGQIRLQWWREALQKEASSVRTGHPVADAVRQAIGRHGLSRSALIDVIDARALVMQGETPLDDAALEAYLANTEGVIFHQGALILGAGPGRSLDTAVTASAQAYGLARHLCASSLRRAEGSDVPSMAKLASEWAAGAAKARSNLASARQAVADLPRELRVVFLPLVMVEPYLSGFRALQRSARPSRSRIAPVRRVARIAIAHWLGRP
jgi:phytoene synthase